MIWFSVQKKLLVKCEFIARCWCLFHVSAQVLVYVSGCSVCSHVQSALSCIGHFLKFIFMHYL